MSSDNELAHHGLVITMAWRSAVKNQSEWFRARCRAAKTSTGVDEAELREQMRAFGRSFVTGYDPECYLDAIVAYALNDLMDGKHSQPTHNMYADCNEQSDAEAPGTNVRQSQETANKHLFGGALSELAEKRWQHLVSTDFSEYMRLCLIAVRVDGTVDIILLREQLRSFAAQSLPRHMVEIYLGKTVQVACQDITNVCEKKKREEEEHLRRKNEVKLLEQASNRRKEEEAQIFYRDYVRPMVDRHLPTLVSKYRLCLDEYGSLDNDKFLREMVRFVRSCIPDSGVFGCVDYASKMVIAAASNRVSLHDDDIQGGVDYERFIMQKLEELSWTVGGTSGSGDQGVDIIAVKELRKVALQAKYYSRPVGNSAVQQIFAGAKFYGLTEAVVVTNAGYTPAAYALGNSLGVRLLSHNDLEHL